nr:MAG: yabby-like transcription factor [Diabrotica toursvirus 3a]
MNKKVNKLVSGHFPEVIERWTSEEFQKKLTKTLTVKTKRERDENAVIKHTPYIQFCMKERPNIKLRYPDLSAKEITSKLGKLWNDYKETNPSYLETEYGYILKN